MKKIQYLCLLSILIVVNSCLSAQQQDAIEVERIVIDSSDNYFGYYLAVKPKAAPIKGLLVLLPGLGQKSEDIFLDTKLHEIAYKHDIMTIGFAGRMRITADHIIRERLSAVLEDVLKTTTVDKNNVFFGGFSAGGVVALRYAELCYQYPDDFSVLPKAVFMADSPVDLFHSWNLKLEDMKNNHSEISVNEGKWMERAYRQLYGATPSENPETFKDLSPFSIDPMNGTNEIYLKEVAVRAYHDIDVAWRIVNRNQTARFDNYIATSELINRLLLLGNEKAEFIQTYQTGYRRNGERHPHSWSIIDAEECIKWINQMMD